MWCDGATTSTDDPSECECCYSTTKEERRASRRQLDDVWRLRRDGPHWFGLLVSTPSLSLSLLYCALLCFRLSPVSSFSLDYRLLSPPPEPYSNTQSKVAPSEWTRSFTPLHVSVYAWRASTTTNEGRKGVCVVVAWPGATGSSFSKTRCSTQRKRRARVEKGPTYGFIFILQDSLELENIRMVVVVVEGREGGREEQQPQHQQKTHYQS